MDAIKFIGKNKIQFVKTSIPKITHPREVVVKVAYSGVCGTDLHIIEGKFPCKQQVTLGHEFSGTVLEFGREVTNLEKGDHVLVDPNNGCHKCHFCHSGSPHFCLHMGFYANLGTKNDGGWAQYCICSAEQIHKIPVEIPLKMAALAEPLSCISHGWDMISPVTIGQNILVIGAGIIGTLWACLLHCHGHKRVTIAELDPVRIQSLKKLFGDATYNLVEPKNLENGDKFDVVIDCSGCCSVIELGLSLMNHGGKFCLFGVAPAGAKIKVSPFDIYMKELTIISVKINPFSFPKAIALLHALGARYLDFDKLGIKVFKLEDYTKALDLLKQKTITKAMFEI